MSNSLSGGYTERFAELSDKDKKDNKGGLFRSRDKGSDGLGPKPDDVRGRWWHESVRTQGSIKGLNYAAIRIAEAYGEGFMEGQVLARLVIGELEHTPSLRDIRNWADRQGNRSPYLQIQERRDEIPSQPGSATAHGSCQRRRSSIVFGRQMDGNQRQRRSLVFGRGGNAIRMGMVKGERRGA